MPPKRRTRCSFPLRGNRLAPASQGGFEPGGLAAHHNAPLTARSPRPSIDRLRHRHRPGMLAAGRATRRRTCHQGGSRGSSPRPTQTRDTGCGPCNPTADMPSGGFKGIVPQTNTDPGYWLRAVQPDGGHAIRGVQGDRPPDQHRPGILAAGRATRRRTCHQGGSRGSSPRPTQTRDTGCGPCNPTADMPSGGFKGIVPQTNTDPGYWLRAVQPDGGHAIRGVQGDRPPDQHRPGILAAGRATRRRTCHQGGSRGSSPRPTQTRDAGCGPCNPTADMPSGGFRGIVPLVDTDSAAGDGEFGDRVVPAALEIAVWESDGAGAVGVASRHA